MSTWEIVSIVLGVLALVIAGSATAKYWADTVRLHARELLLQASEAFQASALMTLQGHEVLGKPDITVEDARACWLAMRHAWDEWADLFTWATQLYEELHEDDA
jgi:hypothetical protein